MSECEHDWQHLNTAQRLWISELEDWVNEKRWFMPPKNKFKVIATKHWVGRIDEYYCRRCLENKTVKRMEEYDVFGDKPDWFSGFISYKYLYEWSPDFEEPEVIDYSEQLGANYEEGNV